MMWTELFWEILLFSMAAWHCTVQNLGLNLFSILCLLQYYGSFHSRNVSDFFRWIDSRLLSVKWHEHSSFEKNCCSAGLAWHCTFRVEFGFNLVVAAIQYYGSLHPRNVSDFFRWIDSRLLSVKWHEHRSFEKNCCSPGLAWHYTVQNLG